MTMTKAVRGRILKDANGDISDHLRNHIHLTNCIHLKNHMHKQSPILADRSLMRDLIVLQRSRSLRDPSASPPSWHSPSIIDLLPKKGNVSAAVQEGRRSVGVDRQREGRRLSGSSPSFGSSALAKVAPADVLGGGNAVPAASDRSSKSGIREHRRVKREESSRKSNLDDILGADEDQLRVEDAKNLVEEVVMDNSVLEERHIKQTGKHGNDVHVKTLSEQLNDVHGDSDKASSNNRFHGRHPQQKKAGQEPQTSIRGYSGLNRAKRRKFRSAKRTQATSSSRDVGIQNEMSVASNSLGQGSVRPRYHKDKEEEEEEYGDQNITRNPQNGCGIPWNWSRIHHRGKTFLDMAGRSLSCGLSDSRLRKGGMPSNERDILGMQVASDCSSSSTKSNAEALPLLVDPYRSDESADNAGWEHNYSGELGIYANHLLKNDVDSDLASEGRSGKLGRNHRSKHQNLTQKYMPRTFRDLVGQNLVSQALSNAVLKKRIGLLYVFYGPNGTGKTSCARIFARALNCQSVEHLKPCGYCNSCVSHDMGKSRTIKEVGLVSNFDFQSIMDLLDNMIISHLPSQYRVFIFDDCDTLSTDGWSAISKVIDRAPRRLVFILVSSSLEVLPHIIISRCQKFFFPKLKDADVIYTLQWIASQENIDIDKDALKLIATRSDGSLRDAEMTLEQLSLLGQRISVPLVQELIGLISDEKLVNLLDLALSADTVNTVKNLRAIMESGVEPLALMSQIATVITDILAGSYDFTQDRHRRKFFRRQPISKEDMEKLRQALKTLSEAEKQLRMSNDKLTWLTAALLQLAPDQQYLLPGSSTDSFTHSPLVLNNKRARDKVKNSEMNSNEKGVSMQARLEKLPSVVSGASIDRKRITTSSMAPQWTTATSDAVRMDGRQILAKREYKEIWLEVLDKIQSKSIKDFLYQEGKLISVSFGAAPTVQLMFSSHANKLEAEKLIPLIFQAFESVLGSPVAIEIRSELSKDTRAGYHVPLVLPTSKTVSTQMTPETKNGSTVLRTGESRDNGRSEIVEMPPSPRELKGDEHSNNNGEVRKGQHSHGVAASELQSTVTSLLERRRLGEQSKSLVRGKVSLAHVIQQAEGCTQQPGWSKRKAVSIAEKLEQENLRLEPRSRNLLCWKASKVTRPKQLSRLKIRNRRAHSLLKLVSCGKCLSSRSPR